MSLQRWTVIDQSQNIQLTSAHLGIERVQPRHSKCNVKAEVLHGGLSDGVLRLVVDHGSMQYVVLPTRGMGIWKVWTGDTCFGWNSPIPGPVHPAFVPVAEPSGLGWLDGFDELFVRCGLESNGAPEFDAQGRLIYPLHGRIANKPAQSVTVEIDDDQGEVTITGITSEVRFHFLKLQMKTVIKSRIDSPYIHVSDTIENRSAQPVEFQMLYHINFGSPLLEAGSEFVAPVKSLCPRNAHSGHGMPNWDQYAEPVAGFQEQVYFMQLFGNPNGGTLCMLQNAKKSMAASIGFNLNELPYFTLWKNTTALDDGCVTGLEPGTNFPNPRSFEGKAKRFALLGPGESKTLNLELGFHVGSDSVSGIGEEIELLKNSQPALINPQPDPKWCA
jgi:Domain of unknown function (DUF4432)